MRTNSESGGSKRPLSLKRLQFVGEYLSDLDGPRAFRAVYGDNRKDGKPRSPEAIRVAVAKLLGRADVRRELEAHRQQLRERYMWRT